ncbi:condensation domain-containing protein, partial [Ruminococcus flavefaciens]|uniref:condensation domain-containing protein n=1 Tax=Ruminococcus flavefaciens TaxID=1265 RepID=UPI001FA75DBC
MSKINSKIENVYRLSPLQEGMLYYNLVDNSSSAYSLQNLLSVKYNMDHDILKQALSLLSERFSVLRTAFVYEGMKEILQVVLKNRDPEVNYIDITDYDEALKKEKVDELVLKDLQRGYDLKEDSLIRVLHIKYASGEDKILFSLHHIIVDGWCINTLFQKFLYYYSKLSNGETYEKISQEVAAEKNSSCEYSEYIKWLQRQDQSKALEYWKNELEGYDSDAEIKALNKPEPSVEQMRELYGETDAETTEKIIRITEKNESTINVAAEAAVGILLQRYTGSNDVVFGKVVSGRNAPINGIEDMVGLFVNTIPVRVCVDEKITVSELIKIQQEKGTESTNYDYCSLAEIQSKIAQGSELIKVLYVFENYASGAFTDSEDTDSLIKVESTREQTNYGITISAFIKNDRLSFKIMYDPNHFCGDEVQHIMDTLIKICGEIAEKPDCRVNELEIVNESEKNAWQKYNETEEVIEETSLLELVKRQCEKAP